MAILDGDAHVCSACVRRMHCSPKTYMYNISECDCHFVKRYLFSLLMLVFFFLSYIHVNECFFFCPKYAVTPQIHVYVHVHVAEQFQYVVCVSPVE